MKDIKCGVIQDLLPLYVDDVVSSDTKEMVENHLKHCEECQKEYALMKRNLSIPAERSTTAFQKINKKWRKRKVVISIFSILLTTLVLFGAFTFLFHFERLIPYSDDLFDIKMDQDNQLVSTYYGKSYNSIGEHHPVLVNVNGEEKNVTFISYYQTIADSPSNNLINDEKVSPEKGYEWRFSESEKIDAIYYVDFERVKYPTNNNTWKELMEQGVLVWERE
ncbi:zf-HC2 domain-containing protein [Mangrovibacillus cuniculi]|uniref:Anti-sigma-W factor RsiW n=1 Tax=Mangrovibacillus cuniculi TaxID=2593652 RepID=A0A7S8CE40_9BACI|nr:zf-HC2 domain-containing protein [Mangrovibacillus cuniculi]QPC48237.1 zf-HC2 domain-containing protein [Mangrovibacillus cuniculi]